MMRLRNAKLPKLKKKKKPWLLFVAISDHRDVKVGSARKENQNIRSMTLGSKAAAALRMSRVRPEVQTAPGRCPTVVQPIIGFTKLPLKDWNSHHENSKKERILDKTTGSCSGEEYTTPAWLPKITAIKQRRRRRVAADLFQLFAQRKRPETHTHTQARNIGCGAFKPKKPGAKV